jgi:hypothetical protein
MRIIEQTVYNYLDLLLPENRELKDKIVSKLAESEDTYYIWNEAEQTVKRFLNLIDIPIKTYNSWLEPGFSKVDDNILELSGLRLRTWFINNFQFLWKPKYIGCLKTNEYIKHNRIKSPINVNSVGNRFNPYYSGCQLDNCCVLTGMCYDDDFLKPIYDFIKKPTKYNLEDVINECFESLKTTIENEIEYRESEEAILETIEANGYEFDEYGNII